MPGRMMSLSVIDEIAAERKRQVMEEGWTEAHDAREHMQGELSAAAAAYAIHASREIHPTQTGYFSPPPNFWPFSPQWWKPKGPRRDLIRAAALIVAEIDRLDSVTSPESIPDLSIEHCARKLIRHLETHGGEIAQGYLFDLQLAVNRAEKKK